MFQFAIRLIVPCFAVAVLAGCASYYEITNPATGQMYYTQSMSQTGQGAVKFKDARSGSEVTLQNSEVKKITEQEYHDGLRMDAARSAAEEGKAATK